MNSIELGLFIPRLTGIFLRTRPTFLLKWSNGVEQTHSLMARRLRQSTATESISWRSCADVRLASVESESPKTSPTSLALVSVSARSASGCCSGSAATSWRLLFSRWLNSTWKKRAPFHIFKFEVEPKAVLNSSFSPVALIDFSYFSGFTLYCHCVLS